MAVSSLLQLYAPVIANLTNTSRLLARLTSIPVLANSYLGIPAYTLDEILILSNARAPSFLTAFEDSRVSAAVSSQWPDRSEHDLIQTPGRQQPELRRPSRIATRKAGRTKQARRAERLRASPFPRPCGSAYRLRPT